jgi:hypothetical protein
MAADLEQLKQKYVSALNFLGQPGASLTHVHIQDDKLYVEVALAAKRSRIRLGIW